jgi:hypothetical protein
VEKEVSTSEKQRYKASQGNKTMAYMLKNTVYFWLSHATLDGLFAVANMTRHQFESQRLRILSFHEIYIHRLESLKKPSGLLL